MQFQKRNLQQFLRCLPRFLHQLLKRRNPRKRVKTANAASMTFRLPKASFALAKSISFANPAWPIS